MTTRHKNSTEGLVFGPLLRWRVAVLSGVALGAMAASAAAAEPAAAEQTLKEHALRLERSGRDDMAIRDWLRVLLSDPADAEALYNLARIEARAGHDVNARTYADRFQATHPDDPRLTDLTKVLAGGKIDPQLIEEARRLARAGENERAVDAYRRAFGNELPPQNLAREFYETMAGVPDSQDEAARRLAALADETPDDPETKLAAARVLTYQEATRRRGIEILSGLADSSAGAAAAEKAWHDALGWLDLTPADAPLLQAWINRHPADRDMRDRLLALREPDKAPAAYAGLATREGFLALEGGRLADAERVFAQVTKTAPNDVDAIGGLGLVRLRQGRFGEAKTLLEKASSDPAANGKWQTALRAASYWGAIDMAKDTIKQGRTGDAEAMLRTAAGQAPGSDVVALVMLADLAAAKDKPDEAERMYREALAKNAGDSAAVRGLTAALIAQGKTAEAKKLAEQSGNRAIADRLEAQTVLAGARASQAGGDVTAALDLYRKALAAAPKDPWARLDYARALRANGADDAANGQIVRLSEDAPDADALYAASLYRAETGHPDEAMALLERVPPKARSAAMKTALETLRLRSDAAAAGELARHGDRAAARAKLDQLAAHPSLDAETIASLARGYAESGDRPQALAVMRHLLAGPHTDNRALLAYAGLLLQFGETQELQAVLGRLEHTSLSPTEAKSVADLRAGGAVRAADAARADGDNAAAWDALQPALAGAPGDPGATAALARIYMSAGRKSEAMTIYTKTLAAHPDDLVLRRESIGAALAANDRDAAKRWLAEGLKNAPNDAGLHVLAAQVARADGRPDDAKRELATAERLFHQDSPVAERALAMNASPSRHNPFRSADTIALKGALDVDGAPLDPAAADRAQLASAIEAEAKSEAAANSTMVDGGVEIRHRTGQEGLDGLTELATPVHAAMPVAGGRLTATITPIQLSSGALDGNNPLTARIFGSNALLGPTSGGPVPSGSATGVGFAVGWKNDSLDLDAGTTPLGFAVESAVGGATWAPKIGDNTTLRLSGTRRAVTDSVLSYAGQKDPLSGTTFGGVTNAEGKGELDWDNGVKGAFVGAGFGFLSGKGVASNTMEELYGGAYTRPYKTESSELKIGVSLFGEGYDKNLSHFTLGQGGYFSPQSFLKLALPVDYTAHGDRWRWNAGLALGFETFHDDGAPYFPNNPGLQAALLSTGGVSSFAGQSTTGAALGLHLGGEYDLAPDLTIGGQLKVDSAPSYSEQSIWFYVTKKFGS